MYHMALFVRHNLKLNMPGLFNIPLQVHGIIGKSLYGLHLGIDKIRLKIIRPIGYPHSLTAAAGGSLNHHRITDFLRHGFGVLHLVHRLLASRHHRYPGLHHGLSGL